MSKKLFIGRLPFDFTDEKLGALFSPLGTVLSATMVPDPKNGRSRGFGFVTMKTDAETAMVISKLNGFRIGEKDIWVTEAREPEPKAPKAAAPGHPPLQNRPGRPGAPRSEGFRPPRPLRSGSDRFGATPRQGFSDDRPRRFGPSKNRSRKPTR